MNNTNTCTCDMPPMENPSRYVWLEPCTGIYNLKTKKIKKNNWPTKKLVHNIDWTKPESSSQSEIMNLQQMAGYLHFLVESQYFQELVVNHVDGEDDLQ